MRQIAVGHWVLVCLLFSVSQACAPRQIKPEQEQNIRILHQIPTGIACKPLHEVRLRDGIGCAYVGTTRPGSPEILMLNLRQQARKHGANTAVLLGEIMPDQWDGCPANGLVVDAAFYHCEYSL